VGHLHISHAYSLRGGLATAIKNEPGQTRHGWGVTGVFNAVFNVERIALRIADRCVHFDAKKMLASPLGARPATYDPRLVFWNLACLFVFEFTAHRIHSER
jgi:hypothetical protein